MCNLNSVCITCVQVYGSKSKTLHESLLYVMNKASKSKYLSIFISLRHEYIMSFYGAVPRFFLWERKMRQNVPTIRARSLGGIGSKSERIAEISLLIFFLSYLTNRLVRICLGGTNY